LRTYATSWDEPPIRIFKDQEYLLPNEGLPKAIRDVLEKPRFLVLMASREATRSLWVEDELKIWCRELKRAHKLLIVLTRLKRRSVRD